MRRVLALLAAVVLASCDARAGEPDAPIAFQDRIVAAPLAGAHMLYDRADYERAMESLDPVLKPLILNGLTEYTQHEVINLYARSAWMSGNYERAYWGYRMSARAPSAGPNDWLGLMLSAGRAGASEDAYWAFRKMADIGPGALERIGFRRLHSLSWRSSCGIRLVRRCRAARRWRPGGRRRTWPAPFATCA